MWQARSSRTKKRGNYQKQFTFIIGSCVCLWSSRAHNNMSVENAIEKLQKITTEKEVQTSEHTWRQEEEAKLLRRTEVKEQLRKTNKGVLNI
jgi:hypothetical protein